MCDKVELGVGFVANERNLVCGDLEPVKEM
jgi:hypothetical protein